MGKKLSECVKDFLWIMITHTVTLPLSHGRCFSEINDNKS